MTRVNHPTKEKFQVPVEQQVTAYSIARRLLDKAKQKCIKTGIRLEDAKRLVKQEEQIETQSQLTSS